MLKDKITKEQFIEYIQQIQEKDNLIRDIYHISKKTIDLIEFEEILLKPMFLLQKIFFSKSELEYIEWFLYEYNKDMMKIYDAKTHEVIADIQTVEDLWEYLNRE